MMTVKFKEINRLYAHKIGDVVEMLDSDALALIESGHVEQVEDGGGSEAKRAEPGHEFPDEIRPDGGPLDTTENRLDTLAKQVYSDMETADQKPEENAAKTKASGKKKDEEPK